MALYSEAHSYALQALHRFERMETDPKEMDRIRKLMTHQVDMLGKYESIDGGWGYYDFRAQTKQPSGSSISFVNATGLVALKEAEQSGVKVPSKMINRALEAIKRQRLPDHSFFMENT